MQFLANYCHIKQLRLLENNLQGAKTSGHIVQHNSIIRSLRTFY